MQLESAILFLVTHYGSKGFQFLFLSLMGLLTFLLHLVSAQIWMFILCIHAIDPSRSLENERAAGGFEYRHHFPKAFAYNQLLESPFPPPKQGEASSERWFKSSEPIRSKIERAEILTPARSKQLQVQLGWVTERWVKDANTSNPVETLKRDIDSVLSRWVNAIAVPLETFSTDASEIFQQERLSIAHNVTQSQDLLLPKALFGALFESGMNVVSSNPLKEIKLKGHHVVDQFDNEGFEKCKDSLGQLTPLLSAYGLAEGWVDPDPNCLFATLIQQLSLLPSIRSRMETRGYDFGCETSKIHNITIQIFKLATARCRQEVVYHLLRMAKETTSDTLEGYVNLMSKETSWAGYCEILAAANLFGVRIHIFEVDSDGIVEHLISAKEASDQCETISLINCGNLYWSGLPPGNSSYQSKVRKDLEISPENASVMESELSREGEIVQAMESQSSPVKTSAQKVVAKSNIVFEDDVVDFGCNNGDILRFGEHQQFIHSTNQDQNDTSRKDIGIGTKGKGNSWNESRFFINYGAEPIILTNVSSRVFETCQTASATNQNLEKRKFLRKGSRKWVSGKLVQLNYTDSNEAGPSPSMKRGIKGKVKSVVSKYWIDPERAFNVSSDAVKFSDGSRKDNERIFRTEETTSDTWSSMDGSGSRGRVKNQFVEYSTDSLLADPERDQMNNFFKETIKLATPTLVVRERHRVAESQLPSRNTLIKTPPPYSPEPAKQVREPSPPPSPQPPAIENMQDDEWIASQERPEEMNFQVSWSANEFEGNVKSLGIDTKTQIPQDPSVELLSNFSAEKSSTVSASDQAQSVNIANLTDVIHEMKIFVKQSEQNFAEKVDYLNARNEVLESRIVGFINQTMRPINLSEMLHEMVEKIKVTLKGEVSQYSSNVSNHIQESSQVVDSLQKETQKSNANLTCLDRDEKIADVLVDNKKPDLSTGGGEGAISDRIHYAATKGPASFRPRLVGAAKSTDFVKYQPTSEHIQRQGPGRLPRKHRMQFASHLEDATPLDTSRFLKFDERYVAGLQSDKGEGSGKKIPVRESTLLDLDLRFVLDYHLNDKLLEFERKNWFPKSNKNEEIQQKDVNYDSINFPSPPKEKDIEDIKLEINHFSDMKSNLQPLKHSKHFLQQCEAWDRRLADEIIVAVPYDEVVGIAREDLADDWNRMLREKRPVQTDFDKNLYSALLYDDFFHKEKFDSRGYQHPTAQESLFSNVQQFHDPNSRRVLPPPKMIKSPWLQEYTPSTTARNSRGEETLKQRAWEIKKEIEEAQYRVQRARDALAEVVQDDTHEYGDDEDLRAALRELHSARKQSSDFERKKYQDSRFIEEQVRNKSKTDTTKAVDGHMEENLLSNQSVVFNQLQEKLNKSAECHLVLEQRIRRTEELLENSTRALTEYVTENVRAAVVNQSTHQPQQLCTNQSPEKSLDPPVNLREFRPMHGPDPEFDRLGREANRQWQNQMKEKEARQVEDQMFASRLAFEIPLSANTPLGAYPANELRPSFIDSGYAHMNYGGHDFQHQWNRRPKGRSFEQVWPQPPSRWDGDLSNGRDFRRRGFRRRARDFGDIRRFGDPEAERRRADFRIEDRGIRQNYEGDGRKSGRSRIDSKEAGRPSWRRDFNFADPKRARRNGRDESDDAEGGEGGEVERLLATAGLSGYEGVLIRNGWDRMSRLRLIKEADLVSMGLKPGHARVMVDSLRRLLSPEP